jgi:hypothetical protein
MVVTNQRLHFFAGSDDGDYHEALNHRDVNTVDVDRSGRYPKFIITASGTKYSFITKPRDEDELQRAKEYMTNPDVRQESPQSQSMDEEKSTVNQGADHTSGADLGTPVLDDDARQYQYKVVNLIEESESVSESGAVEGMFYRMVQEQGGVELPPDDILNRLGKDGWRLVETIEKPATEVGSLTSNEGSMTYALVFRRPVSYVEDSEGSDN